MAAERAGHRIVGVVPGPSGRLPSDRWRPIPPGEGFPDCDLLLISVRDDLIAEVAAQSAGRIGATRVAAHLSGFTSVTALAPLADAGCQIGSMHPLQTLPDPVTGAAALAGSWVAVTGAPALADFAVGLALYPFLLADHHKPAYHAGASAAANFVVECLAVAEELFDAAEVPLAALRPLVDRIVDNCFSLGPAAALTGPVARGDRRTVAGQIEVAMGLSERLGDEYRRLVESLAIRVGHGRSFP